MRHSWIDAFPKFNSSPSFSRKLERQLDRGSLIETLVTDFRQGTLEVD